MQPRTCLRDQCCTLKFLVVDGYLIGNLQLTLFGGTKTTKLLLQPFLVLERA